MYRRDRFTEYSRSEADRIFAHVGPETSFILDDKSNSEEPLIIRIPSTPPSGDGADSTVESEVSNDSDFAASISEDQQDVAPVKDVANDEVSATVEESPYGPIAPPAVEEDGLSRTECRDGSDSPEGVSDSEPPKCCWCDKWDFI